MKQIFTSFLGLISLFTVNAQQITEIHYDNNSTDANERVEITFPTGTNVTGWTLVLYNATGGVTYDTKNISSGTLTTDAGFDIYVIAYPSNGIQNGAPDGLALVNGATLVEFLSYEGVFAATNGPASGITSVNIIASEDGTGTTTGSIQKNPVSGVWVTSPTINTFGSVNPLTLPIKLTSFTATNKTNQINLNWNVASETNIANYEIEKSIDGINFNKMGTVLAQNLSTYNFIDNNITIGNSYYRLKINETNGNFNYSFIAKVKANGKLLNINTIYPSPAIDFIKMQINYTNNINAILQIIDLNGKIVIKENIALVNGLIEKTININHLKVGTYFVKVLAANEISIEKFLKQ